MTHAYCGVSWVSHTMTNTYLVLFWSCSNDTSHAHVCCHTCVSDIIITHCKWHVRVVQLLLLVNTLICEWKRSKSEINCTNRQHNSHQHNSTSIWQDNSRQMPAPPLKVHRVFVFWLCCNTLTLTPCTCTCTCTQRHHMIDANFWWVNGMFGVMTQFA